MSNHHPSSSPVDGIIHVVQDGNYYVEFYREADRRFAGDKTGWRWDSAEFDRFYHPVACPVAWHITPLKGGQ